MVIKQVLNHNVVVSTKDDVEVVVMGKGIAFGKHMGDSIDESKVQKFFYLKDKQSDSRFLQLLSEISDEYVELTQECVEYIKIHLSKKIRDSIYITLLDHINSLVERAKLGAYITNSMLWDIKKIYPDEFSVASDVVDIINQKLEISFDENEVANIAMHIVNAEYDLEFSETMGITKVVTEILNLVKYYFRIVYDEDSISYYRFVTHLRFFAHRLFTNENYDDEENSEIIKKVQEQYQDSYQCALRIKDYLKKIYRYDLCDEECLYLTLHISKVVKGSKKI